MHKEKKTVLDERELMEMYRIEHRGLWLMLALLGASVAAQLLFGAGLAQLAGELAVLLIMCVVLMIAYVRRGIWDEDARPSLRGNARYSAAAGAGVAAVLAALKGQWMLALLVGALTALLCMAVLSALMAYMQRRQRAKENELENEE